MCYLTEHSINICLLSYGNNLGPNLKPCYRYPAFNLRIIRGCFHHISHVQGCAFITRSTTILVQVMAWCSQSTSHNMSQPRSMALCGVTRPQCVKSRQTEWANIVRVPYVVTPCHHVNQYVLSNMICHALLTTKPCFLWRTGCLFANVFQWDQNSIEI